jgi:hypothetical protein
MICRQRTLLYLVPAIILTAGLGSAVLLYLTAENDKDSYLVYEAKVGYVHPMASEDSKIDRRDLRLYGGKANVPAHEFMHWFAGLWHGKSLAFTVACITIYISFGFFLVAYFLLSDPRI